MILQVWRRVMTRTLPARLDADEKQTSSSSDGRGRRAARSATPNTTTLQPRLAYRSLRHECCSRRICNVTAIPHSRVTPSPILIPPSLAQIQAHAIPIPPAVPTPLQRSRDSPPSEPTEHPHRPSGSSLQHLPPRFQYLLDTTSSWRTQKHPRSLFEVVHPFVAQRLCGFIVFRYTSSGLQERSPAS